jgi:hypothetical protein
MSFHFCRSLCTYLVFNAPLTSSNENRAPRRKSCAGFRFKGVLFGQVAYPLPSRFIFVEFSGLLIEEILFWNSRGYCRVLISGFLRKRLKLIHNILVSGRIIKCHLLKVWTNKYPWMRLDKTGSSPTKKQFDWMAIRCDATFLLVSLLIPLPHPLLFQSISINGWSIWIDTSPSKYWWLAIWVRMHGWMSATENSIARLWQKSSSQEVYIQR